MIRKLRLVISIVLFFQWQLLGEPARNEPCIYLAHTFEGQPVSIDIDGKSIFFGRVLTEGGSQLAAILPVFNGGKVLNVKISVRATSGDKLVSLEEKVNLDKGFHMVVFFVHGQLSIVQEVSPPEFY